jgi:hypothetical protein
MFECGLEGVSLKVVRRSQFVKGENGNEGKTEQPDTETGHTDTVTSQDELEQQSAANTSGRLIICNCLILFNDFKYNLT